MSAVYSSAGSGCLKPALSLKGSGVTGACGLRSSLIAHQLPNMDLVIRLPRRSCLRQAQTGAASVEKVEADPRFNLSICLQTTHQEAEFSAH